MDLCPYMLDCINCLLIFCIQFFGWLMAIPGSIPLINQFYACLFLFACLMSLVGKLRGNVLLRESHCIFNMLHHHVYCKGMSLSCYCSLSHISHYFLKCICCCVSGVSLVISYPLHYVLVEICLYVPCPSLVTINHIPIYTGIRCCLVMTDLFMPSSDCAYNLFSCPQMGTVTGISWGSQEKKFRCL